MIPACAEPIKKYILENVFKLNKKPLILGLSGPQGAGKSTVVQSVAVLLRDSGLNVVQFSLDDIYLTHADQVRLRDTSENRLVACRGLPGTHDIKLCLEVFQSLCAQEPTDIPVYDKSAFEGQGDRAFESVKVTPPYDVILFEGWMVGFSPLSDTELSDALVESTTNNGSASRFTRKELELMNISLHLYENQIWSQFDSFIHLDALDIKYIYKWRLQQEHHMISIKGRGMTDEQVRRFVDGYMPAYELYNGKLKVRPGLHVKLDEDRNIAGIVEL